MMTDSPNAALLQLESDRDAGVAPRLLDLLTVQRRLPDQLTVDWHPDRICFALRYADDAGLSASLVARLRQLPGMRSVSVGPQR